MIAGLILSFALLMLAMTAHEFSHGWVADKLGDPTAKYSGRLTLNPLAHIDPIGTILLPLVLFFATQGRFVFGAAKPVPVNYRALRNPKIDMIWIGLAGPCANFIFALALSLALKLIPFHSAMLTYVIETLIAINVLLGVFNLIPIPPLDGSRVLMGILPGRLAYSYSRIEPFGFIIIVALIGLGIFNTLIEPVVGVILTWLLA